MRVTRSAPAGPVAHPFAPVGNEASRVLILGTMPSVQSRARDFYYSHPKNRFWPVIAACLRRNPPEEPVLKAGMLLESGIALWDVLASCVIAGSRDASIRIPVFNDLEGFCSDKPIEKILCNGQAAFNLLERSGQSPAPAVRMPSTSPANAAWSLERLIEAWRREL